MECCDILIVGAGIAGTSLAYHLASDRSVAILEQESQPGYHATGRSAALLLETYGAPMIRALASLSREFFEHPPDDFTSDPLLKKRGLMWIAEPGSEELLEVAHRGYAAAAGAQVQRLSPVEAREFCPALRRQSVCSALFEPGAQDIDVHNLQSSFLRGLRRKGGRLFTNAPVRSIARNGGRWLVQADSLTVNAGLLVNAGGAWCDEIARLAGVGPLGFTPKRRTAVTFEVDGFQHVEDWPCVLEARERFYFKPETPGLLASAADETPSVPCDAQPQELDVALALDRFEHATHMIVRKLRAKWAGLRTFAPDNMPVLGPDPLQPSFFWLAGQGGHGVMTSPALAQASASLLGSGVWPDSFLQSGVPMEALSPARFRSAEARSAS